MPVLIASGTNVANTTATNNDLRQCFVMSDSRRVVIYGSGILSYRTSADGITWSSAATVTGTNGAGQKVVAITQVGDTLYIWQIGASGNLVKAVYSTGTNLLTMSTPSIPSGVTFLLGSSATSLAIGYDAGNSRFYGVPVHRSVIIPFELPVGLSTYAATLSGPDATGPSLAVLDIAVSGSTTLVLYTDTTGLWVYPMTFSGSVFSSGGPELVVAGTIVGGACALSGVNLDVVWMDNAGNLLTRKRTGTAVYTGQQSIGSAGNTSFPNITLTTDGSDLIALYSSVISQSAGEVYLAKRTSGIWSLGVMFVGGDASGYRLPKSSAATATSRTDVIYQKGADVYYGPGTGGSGPNTPSISAPVGFETSLTPTITAPYVNSSSPTDTQGAFEDKVLDGLTVMWDSGEVTSAATSNVYGTNSNVADPNYVAPSALVYGTTYTVSRRYKDSELLPTVWSSFSAPVSFTPVQGGTVTITSLSDGGTVAGSTPVALGSPSFDYIVGSWSHPLAHSADQYQDVIYAADGVTVKALGIATSIGGGLASGASFTSGPWNPVGLANSTTYKLARRYRDATTLLWSESALWTLNSSWTPPPAPTSFATTPHPDLGYQTLTWVPGGAAVSITLQRAPTGTSDWTVLSSGSLLSTLKDYTDLGAAFDYQVFAVNTLGIVSAPATLTDVTLGVNGVFGVCLVDSTNPAVIVWLGALADWKQASTFDEPDDVLTYVPLGADLPIESKRRQSFSQAMQREYIVPPTGPYGAGGSTVNQAVTIATLRAMAKAFNPCWYRDVNGESMYVKIKNVQRGTAQDGFPLRRVQFDMVQTEGPGAPLTG